MSTRLVLRTLALAALVGTGASAQSPQGEITGRVTDAISGQPVAAAQVSVVGTTLGAQSNNDGRYTIRGLTPGQYTVRLCASATPNSASRPPLRRGSRRR